MDGDGVGSGIVTNRKTTQTQKKEDGEETWDGLG